jgi:hypothetical protein
VLLRALYTSSGDGDVARQATRVLNTVSIQGEVQVGKEGDEGRDGDKISQQGTEMAVRTPEEEVNNKMAGSIVLRQEGEGA